MNAENELLVVSFGTTSAESRKLNIESVEKAISEVIGENWNICRCFTSQTIINIIVRKENIRIDNISEALEKAASGGVKNLVVQPTHLMKGLEYDKLCNILADYAGSFTKVAVGDPLLTSDDDFTGVADALIEASAVYEDGKTAIVFMGHGTEGAMEPKQLQTAFMIRCRVYLKVREKTITTSEQLRLNLHWMMLSQRLMQAVTGGSCLGL